MSRPQVAIFVLMVVPLGGGLIWALTSRPGPSAATPASGRRPASGTASTARWSAGADLDRAVERTPDRVPSGSGRESATAARSILDDPRIIELRRYQGCYHSASEALAWMRRPRGDDPLLSSLPDLVAGLGITGAELAAALEELAGSDPRAEFLCVLCASWVVDAGSADLDWLLDRASAGGAPEQLADEHWKACTLAAVQALERSAREDLQERSLTSLLARRLTERWSDFDLERAERLFEDLDRRSGTVDPSEVWQIANGEELPDSLRCDAWRFLGRTGDPRTIELVIAEVERGNPRALEGLGSLGDASFEPRILEMVRRFLGSAGSTDRPVALAAVQAIGAMAGKEGLALLDRCLRGEHGHEARRLAIEGIARFENPRLLGTLALWERSGFDSSTRQALRAASTAAHAKLQDRRLPEHLLQPMLRDHRRVLRVALDHHATDLGMEALFHLARWGDQSDLPRLEFALSVFDPGGSSSVAREVEVLRGRVCSGH